MSISYPLAASAFWEALRFASRPEFVLSQNRKQSGDGAGNTLSAFYGAPKWTVDVSLAGGRHNRNLTQEADIKHLEGRDGTFLAYDIRKPYPVFDPTGAILGASTVQVKSKGSNNRSLALKGLPAAYQITKTDKISILYGSTKRFLFEVMETVTADGSGDTTEFEIQPFIPTSVAVNDAVTLVKPCGKFKIVAASYSPSSGRGDVSDGVGFSMISVP